MSYRVKVFAAAAALLSMGSLAWGADLSPAPVAAPVSYTWSGLYIGLNAGYASPNVEETVSGAATGSGSTSIPGGLGGAQIGANYQTGYLVLGFETDLDGSMANKSTNIDGVVTGDNKIPWLGTLRGRVGLALDRWLLYATAGGAATELRSNVAVAGVGSASVDRTHGGWTAGGGLEFAITDSLSAKLEYLYFDTGSFGIAQVAGTPPPPFAEVDGRIRESVVRAGLNYRLPVAW